VRLYPCLLNEVITAQVQEPLSRAQDASTPASLAHMCMDPATFMPNQTFYYQCHTSNSDDPAVETDCPEECKGWSHLDEVDGTMKYYCWCEASSAEECADMYPGEQPRLMQRMPQLAVTLLQQFTPESCALSRYMQSWKKASFES
jgi:hypothetical protein